MDLARSSHARIVYNPQAKMAGGGRCLPKCEVLPGGVGRHRVAGALIGSLLILYASSYRRWCAPPQLAFLPAHSLSTSTSQGAEQDLQTLVGRLSRRTPASSKKPSPARLLQPTLLPYRRTVATVREAEKESPSKSQADDEDLVPGFILAGLATGALSPLLLERIPIASLLETLAVRGLANRSLSDSETGRLTQS